MGGWGGVRAGVAWVWGCVGGGRFCRVCRPQHTDCGILSGPSGGRSLRHLTIEPVEADILIGPARTCGRGQNPSPTMAVGREHVGDGLQDVPKRVMRAGNTRPYGFIREKA